MLVNAGLLVGEFLVKPTNCTSLSSRSLVCSSDYHRRGSSGDLCVCTGTGMCGVLVGPLQTPKCEFVKQAVF